MESTSTTSLVKLSLLGGAAVATSLFLLGRAGKGKGKKSVTVGADGISAVESVTNLLNDFSLIVRPDAEGVYRCLGDETIINVESGKSKISIEKTQLPQGYLSAVKERIEAGERVSILVSNAAAVLSMIPMLYQLADQKLPCVVHVFPGAVDHDLSYNLCYAKVMAAQNTGFGYVSSHSVLESQHMALAIQAASKKLALPFLHIVDTAYIGTAKSSLLSESTIQSSFSSLDLVAPTSDEGGEEAASTNLYLKSGGGFSDAVPELVQGIFDDLESTFGKAYKILEYVGPADAKYVVVAMGQAANAVEAAVASTENVGVLKVRLFRPWSAKHFLAAIPASVTHISVLEHCDEDPDEWGPLYLDVIASVQSMAKRPVVINGRFASSMVEGADVEKIVSNLTSVNPSLTIFAKEEASSYQVPSSTVNDAGSPTIRPENSYVKIIKNTLGADRVLISNMIGSESVWGGSQETDSMESELKAERDVEFASDVQVGNANDEYGDIEYGYGVLLACIQRRKQLINTITSELADDVSPLSADFQDALREWLAVRDDSKKCAAATEKILSLLSKERQVIEDTNLVPLLTQALLHTPSQWLVGGSNWAYDLSTSGVHHVIASGQNINVLVVETEILSTTDRPKSGTNWKKDIGLYAMNYGGVYVASVAMYSSYTQVLHAMMEADAFDGPSIVLAYAPVAQTGDANEQALSMLKETKTCVDNGKWPLYRWNPKKESQFTMDSHYIKKQLEQFLERDNQLSLMVKEVPQISAAIKNTLGSEIKAKHQELQKESVDNYLELLKGLNNAEPVLVLYGSDGGNASGVAKRIVNEANGRGLDAKLLMCDDVSVADLKEEKNVVCVISTAGQGEFPANSQSFYKSLRMDAGPGHLIETKFTVFALGDSHYWPRAGDEHFFAKAGKDLDGRLEEIGGQHLVPLGIGDDQDDDGYETGLANWLPSLWDALGVGAVENKSKVVEKTDDENKIASNFLRGTIVEGLQDESTGALAEADTKLTKFHGIYQQDDRDLRESRRQQNLEKAFSFMIRVRVPGGKCTPAQYIAMDELGDTRGNGTIKLTTRQAFQLHGVIKKELKQTIADINTTLMDTLAACGDVNRNVMAPANAQCSAKIQRQVQQFCCDLSAHLSPQTSAYHEIWLDKKQVAGYQDFEPLYGPTYLPRKFKIGVAIPPDNDADIFANCLGYIAIIENDELVGFNVTVGGGMGMTHSNKKTYPRTADMLGFAPLDKAIEVGEKVMLTQRDFGCRTNRKHARFKYTVEDIGLDAVRANVEKECGYKLEPPREFVLTHNGDRFGWTQNSEGKWCYTMFIENGRIKDTPEYPLKTGLKDIISRHTGDVVLTGTANIALTNCDENMKKVITDLMAKYKIGNKQHSALRLHSMACASLPYCGLAFAESERYQPSLISKLEVSLDENGLRHDAITMRMTGCPNGCARPYIAEIGLVGRAPGTYNLYLGAGHHGQRLSKLYAESVKEDAIIEILNPLFAKYATEKKDGERFGDFLIRSDVVCATSNGADFHVNTGPKAEIVN